MKHRYNLYKIKQNRKEELIDKVKKIGLVKQKSIEKDNYRMTFYFSEDLEGNDVWWYSIYRDFFNFGVSQPKNLFHFGLFLVEDIDPNGNVYAISLGKSHFYISQFVVKNFGIEIASRIASERTMTLKRSRMFGSSKVQEVSSYIDFELENYEAGESVEHIKAKASDKDLWGEKPIIFADSIQMDHEYSPEDIIYIVETIESELEKSSVISFPKLEYVKDEGLIEILDLALLESIVLGCVKNVSISEFESSGAGVSFSYNNISCKIFCMKGRSRKHVESYTGALDINEIAGYINKLPDDVGIGDIKVQFVNPDSGRFTRSLKEILDCQIYYKDSSGSYFLKQGDWYYFNFTFMENLKRSLLSIQFDVDGCFNDADFKRWKSDKERKIDSGVYVENKITYREYYFNLRRSEDDGYILMDREMERINNLEKTKGRRSYSVEVADLYKSGTAWSVKIGSDKEAMIYNIEQSKDSAVLINHKEITVDYDIDSYGLWFVMEKDINSILDISSLQTLLAIESWRRAVEGFGKNARIKFTKLINK